MKNILLKVICVIALVLGFKTSGSAQLVHIPDSAFRAYLNQNFGGCMVGDSIDSSCPAVIAAKNINVINRGISNLSGIEVFVNDTLLNCNYNQLITLPILPPLLKQLHCKNNQLTTLPSFPSLLTDLDCGLNQLTSLPPLPLSLINLDCFANQLTSLQTLPLTIKKLYCNNNQLTFLFTLPPTIKYLVCNFNSLTSLPSLPSSLIELQCRDNQLTSLPSLPSSLLDLVCANNQLTSLPTLSPLLLSLYCGGNQLSSLPNIPSNLWVLNCQYNPLFCLPNLNRITNLDFTGTQVNCISSYGLITTSYPALSTISICDVFNTNGCEVFWNIEGSAFFDTDTNCIVGANEPLFKNQKLNLYKNGVLDQQTYSNVNGDYDFDTFSFDFYKTEFDTTGLPFEAYCPSSGYYLDTISTADSMKYDRDFGLKCKGVDLAATNIFSNNLRPASIREIKISAGDYSNYFGAHCAEGISGTVNITITGACTYISPAIGALTPNTVIGNVLTYNVADFGTVSYDSSFNFNILVDTTAALGSQICIQVSISTNTTEINYNNNLLSQCFTVVGSFDPNDKAVFPPSMDISGDRWLTYIIRFQNTGTADAEHIYITDTLSPFLDWSTFSLLSYSHQPLTQVYNDGLVKFSFPHINLPDSNTNEPDSHGYVQYKIRAKDSLALGNSIENTANIFFDFNVPVITNTTSNAVINCSIPPTIIIASICEGDSYSLNGVLYINDGIYDQKFITTVGCDSIVKLDLNVIPLTNQISIVVCDSSSYNFNGLQLTTPGFYTDTLLNSLNCDSIVNLNLQFSMGYQFQQQVSICQNDNYLFAGNLISQAGIYYDSLQTITGCDSIIILDLQTISISTSQISDTICDGTFYNFNGQLVSVPGIYTDTLLNFLGCDSIIELQLTVSSITNTISQSSAILQTTASGSGYQWIDCATNSAITGATNSTYQPTQSGDYAVAVTYGNCIDTSSCFSFSMVGLPSSIGADVFFQTRYNSNADQIQLHAKKLKGNKGVLRLMDISGRIIFQKQIENIAAGILEIEIPAKGMNAGIYLVNLITERDNVSGKVVKY